MAHINMESRVDSNEPSWANVAQSLVYCLSVRTNARHNRPAARVILGEELQRRGYRVDCLLQVDNSCHKAHTVSMDCGHTYIGATDDGDSRWCRVRKYLLDFFNDCRMVGLVRRNPYDLIKVKVKFIKEGKLFR